MTSREKHWTVVRDYFSLRLPVVFRPKPRKFFGVSFTMRNIECMLLCGCMLLFCTVQYMACRRVVRILG